MEYLLIQLPAQPQVSPISYAVVDESKSIQSVSVCESLEALAELACDRQIIIIVSGLDILLTHTIMPANLKGKSLLKAIPYALEEEINDDLTELHFVVAPQNKKSAVAIISHQIMKHWLNAWQQVQFDVQEMIPEPLMLQREDKHWTIILEKEIAIVRIAELEGFSIEIDNVLQVITGIINKEKQQPQQIDCFYRRQHHGIVEQLEQLSTIPLKYTEISPQIENYLFHHLDLQAQNSALNLLQNDYQQAPQREHHYYWQIASVVLICLSIVVLFFGKIQQQSRLEQQQQQINTKIAELYFLLYPNEQQIINPQQRIQGDIARLKQHNKKFLLFIYAVGDAVHKQQLEIDSIHYAKHKLALRLNLNTFQQLETLTKDLIGRGFKVKRERATTQENKVQARLIIKRATP